MGRLAGIYPAPNFAVEVCCKAFLDATRQSREEKRSQADIARIGNLASRLAFPAQERHTMRAKTREKHTKCTTPTTCNSKPISTLTAIFRKKHPHPPFCPSNPPPATFMLPLLLSFTWPATERNSTPDHSPLTTDH